MSGISTTGFERAENRGPARRLSALVLMLVAMLLATVGATQPATAAAPLQLTAAVNAPQFFSGQSVVTYGYLKSSSGKPLGSRTVYVQKATSSGWVTIATTTTNSTGHYRLYVREASSFKLRTYAKAYKTDTAAASASIQLTRIDGTQTLEQRYAQLKPWLKAATDSVKVRDSFGVPVRYQRFQNGVLFEAKGRVYLVAGALLNGYLSVNGVAGKLGRPISDADCYLVTTKCIQPFARGAIYHNTGSVTARKTHIAYGQGVGAELIAVAMSQVGYREPSYYTNKYTAWNGLKTAWCGVFQSWVSAAGKNGSVVPQVKTFPELVSAVKQRGITSKPQVGALVFMTFNGGSAATHTGLVTKVHANGSVDTIEGNTVLSPDTTRLVAKKTRTPSQIRYYYVPGT